jgi:hypothetical protein
MVDYSKQMDQVNTTLPTSISSLYSVFGRFRTGIVFRLSPGTLHHKPHDVLADRCSQLHQSPFLYYLIAKEDGVAVSGNALHAAKPMRDDVWLHSHASSAASHPTSCDSAAHPSHQIGHDRSCVPCGAPSQTARAKACRI